MRNGNRRINLILITAFACVCICVITHCSDPLPLIQEGARGETQLVMSEGDTYKIDFGNAKAATVSIPNLDNSMVYVATINHGTSALAPEHSSRVVKTVNDGITLTNSALPSLPPLSVQDVSAAQSAYLQTRLTHNNAQERWNTYVAKSPSFRRTARGNDNERKGAQNFADAGDLREFYVEYAAEGWKKVTATLRAVTDCVKVWVVDGALYDNASLDENAAAELAATYTAIYDWETTLLGFEYGGGEKGNGGADKDKHIQILVYDMKAPDVIGYFWSKDYYSQQTLDREYDRPIYTNNAEIIYVNAYYKSQKELLYLTLAHETQHLIQFNQKTIKHGITAATWYNEMMSLMIEDLAAAKIGVSANDIAHPAHARLPLFLESYYKTDFYGNNGMTPETYSLWYAFGAFLARNYGGPRLVQSMMNNHYVNESSLIAALKENSYFVDFRELFDRFSQSLVFSCDSCDSSVSTASRRSLNTLSQQTINGYEYTFAPLDITEMKRLSGNYRGPLMYPDDISLPVYPALPPSAFIIEKVTAAPAHGAMTISITSPRTKNGYVNNNVATYIYIN